MGKYIRKIGITEIALALLFIFSIFLSLSAAIPTTLYSKTNYPNGVSHEDWNRHSVWIKNIINGNFSTIYDYPPYFHLTMIPFVLLLGENIRFMQIIFAVLTTAMILYFAYEMENKYVMIFLSILLGTNIVFITFNSQLVPQTLDYYIFPLVVMSFFKKKNFIASAGLISLIYNHLVGIFFLGIIFIYSIFKRKDFLKYFIFIVICCLPIFFIYYLPNLIDIIRFFDGKVDNNMFIVGGNATTNFTETGQMFENSWSKQFVSPIENFFIFNGFIAWSLLPFSLYILYRKKFKLSEMQIFYIVWCLCLMPMIIFNALRWSSYFMIPFSLLIVSILVGKDVQ